MATTILNIVYRLIEFFESISIDQFVLFNQNWLNESYDKKLKNVEYKYQILATIITRECLRRIVSGSLQNGGTIDKFINCQLLYFTITKSMKVYS